MTVSSSRERDVTTLFGCKIVEVKQPRNQGQGQIANVGLISLICRGSPYYISSSYDSSSRDMDLVT